MSRPIPGALLGAMLGAALSTQASTQAQAADMPFAADAPAPVNEEMFEWGSNWYLRGDIGWQHLTVPAISADLPNRTNDLFFGGLGFGYQVNEWIRTDLTVDRSVVRSNGAIGGIWCPYRAVPLHNLNGDPVGIFADPNETCTKYADASLKRTTFMANAYVDLTHFWGFTPYIGGGIGASYNQVQSSLTYYRNSDRGIWAPDLTIPDGEVPRWIYLNGTRFPTQLPFGPTNWNLNRQRSNWQFAWNVMAGVAYDLTENLKIDVGYRYLNAGRYASLPSFNAGYIAPVSKDITSHEVRVGLRLLAN